MRVPSPIRRVTLADALGVSGIDVYEALTVEGPELIDRFVFATGGAFTARARAFADAHRDRLLEKPVDAPALLRAITERIAGR